MDVKDLQVLLFFFFFCNSFPSDFATLVQTGSALLFNLPTLRDWEALR